MPDIIIEPSILPSEEELEGSCLFCLSPYEVGILKRIFTPPESDSFFLFQSNFYRIRSNKRAHFYWAGPAIGSPMAVMTLEKLIARGLSKFIIVGWCGSLKEQVRAAELVIPSWGISEEGTSRHYLGSSRCHLPGFFRKEVADHLSGAGFAVHDEPVLTTDALYRESWSKLKSYRDEGIAAIDMEFTALARLAAFRGVEVAVILIVSDEIRKGISKPFFKGKVFKKKSNDLLRSLINFLKNKEGCN